MFLKKLFGFGKDYTHYVEKGDKYLADEQFAYARNAYGEALEKIQASGGEALSMLETVRSKIALTGNMLGGLNMVEAEHAISCNDSKKAEEHLNLILELADDGPLREKTSKLLAELYRQPAEVVITPPLDKCSSCKGGAGEAEDIEAYETDGNISSEDRLSLFFHALPGDLPERYAAMGDMFARGCLLKLEGHSEEALRLFDELSADSENDILNYERAILYYEKSDFEKSEQLLLKAIDINRANPLCNLGLVHFYTETNRVGEALQILKRMVECDIMPEQAMLMQGDLHAILQDDATAVEHYSKLLVYPKYAKEAAERIVPVLERQGRTKEAEYLFKKYAKGCC